jgi:hypothetical protein
MGAENLASPGFNPRTVQPVVSHYTDYAIPSEDKMKIISEQTNKQNRSLSLARKGNSGQCFRIRVPQNIVTGSAENRELNTLRDLKYREQHQIFLTIHENASIFLQCQLTYTPNSCFAPFVLRPLLKRPLPIYAISLFAVSHFRFKPFGGLRSTTLTPYF